MLTFVPLGSPIVPIACVGLDVIVASFFFDRKGVRLCLPIAYQREAIEALARALGYDENDVRLMAFDEEPIDDHIIRRIVDIGKARPPSERALTARMLEPGTVYVHSDSIGTLVIDPKSDRLTLSLEKRSVDIAVSESMPRYMALYQTMLHMASSVFDPSSLLLTSKQIDDWIDERTRRSVFSYEYFIPGGNA
jgi:hypothetical protein